MPLPPFSSCCSLKPCAWCMQKAKNSAGKWGTFDCKVLEGEKVSHSICPECAEESLKELLKTKGQA